MNNEIRKSYINNDLIRWRWSAYDKKRPFVLL